MIVEGQERSVTSFSIFPAPRDPLFHARRGAWAMMHGKAHAGLISVFRQGARLFLPLQRTTACPAAGSCRRRPFLEHALEPEQEAMRSGRAS